MPGSASVSRSSGFNVDVSRKEGDIDAQAKAAIRFLKRYDTGLRRLARCNGLNGMTLDFGLYDRTTAQRPWPTYRLPAALTALAGKLGIEIELSFYGSGLHAE